MAGRGDVFTLDRKLINKNSEDLIKIIFRLALILGGK